MQFRHSIVAVEELPSKQCVRMTGCASPSSLRLLQVTIGHPSPAGSSHHLQEVGGFLHFPNKPRLASTPQQHGVVVPSCFGPPSLSIFRAATAR
uniref:Predicted protein n=1 Tax=Hordeum vulgare subsp. vulgare TaxID=112509 RepID=F2EC47_HORVV|nr:predicted protein [Hordeum vulgare subsp. vulgare]